MRHHDHPGHCLGSAEAILKELQKAVERRGMSKASFSEVFFLRKLDFVEGEPQEPKWRDFLSANLLEALPDAFAKAVSEEPDAEWRIVVRHRLDVETTLVEYSSETRG